MVIIAIGGRRRSGKDTFGGYLRDELISRGYHVKRFWFASEVKRECARMLGVTPEEMEARKELFRPFLQWYGTEWMQEYCGDRMHWVDRLRKTLESENFTEAYHVAIICDLRLQHELRWVRRQSGYYIRVIRPGSVVSSLTDNHKTENDLISIEPDWRINNVTTKTELRQQAVEFIEERFEK